MAKYHFVFYGCLTQIRLVVHFIYLVCLRTCCHFDTALLIIFVIIIIIIMHNIHNNNYETKLIKCLQKLKYTHILIAEVVCSNFELQIEVQWFLS